MINDQLLSSLASLSFLLLFLFCSFLNLPVKTIMNDEERPRKQPKLSSGRVDGNLGEHTMTGALLPAEQDSGDETPEANCDGREQEKENKTAGDGEQSEPKISKHQQKKLRRKEQWEASRDLRKAKRKEKLIAKRERKRTERDAAGKEREEEGKGFAGRDADNSRGRRRPFRQPTTLLPITFVLDCSYDDLMLEKERISLASQITRSYSDNSRASYHGHLVVTSFDKLLKERFDTVLSKMHENWKGVRFMQEDFVHAAEAAKEWMSPQKGEQQEGNTYNKMAGMFTEKGDAKPEDGEVVYLSSDSLETLTELKPYSTYIIGGLVDKNRHKGICYKKAMERGIRTAKLPIGDYIRMASRATLATSHVIEIMLKWLELGDWGVAFMQVIPSRKGGVLKATADINEEAETTEHDVVQVEENEGPADGKEDTNDEAANVRQEG